MLDDILEQLRDSVTIRQIMIERYGKEITANGLTHCDFHDDHTPSLSIYNDDKYYKCFACGAGKSGQELHLPDGSIIKDGGNDIFGYVMNKERVSFQEAVKIVAEHAGVEIPEYKDSSEAAQLKEEITDRNREFCRILLQDEEAMSYLKERGLDKEDILTWRLGMVPWNWADKRYAGRIVFGLIEHHHSSKKAKTIAMAYRVRNKEDYIKHGYTIDDMKNHLYAKTNEEGKIISLNPKYYNDANSLIYQKKKYIYGFTQAIEAMHSIPSDKRFFVVTEGYMDVILLHKAGIKTAIATCSNQITDEQAEILASKAKKIYLWLDGDQAGLLGAKRSLTKLLTLGCEVMIVYSPDEDPADVVLKGKDVKEFIIRHATPAVQFFLDQELKRYEKTIYEARLHTLNEILPIIESIKKPADKIHFQSILQQRLHVHF